jgi:hypothetical protein
MACTFHQQDTFQLRKCNTQRTAKLLATSSCSFRKISGFEHYQDSTRREGMQSNLVTIQSIPPSKHIPMQIFVSSSGTNTAMN